MSAKSHAARRPSRRSGPAARPARDPSPSGTLPVVRRPDLALLLAHDLRSPMSTLALNLEYVLSAAALTPDVRSAIEDCVAANVRALRIVSDMAEAAIVARDLVVPSEEFPTDVQGLLDEAVRSLAVLLSARRTQLVRRGEPTLTGADPALLGRALERVLEWTLRHTEMGGTVELTCEARVVSLRARVGGPTGTSRAPAASLLTHYADTVVRAQGGGVWTEVDDQNILCVTVAVPP